jgi:hypothetical protein
MKRAAALCSFIVFAAAGLAGAATYDLSGTWDLAYTATAHTGPCPAGVTFDGAATIEQTGDTFTMTVTSGMACEPAFTCVFEGTIVDTVYTGSNSGEVPGGGTASNDVEFTASSAAHAEGTSGSVYSYEGTDCTWDATIVLSREVPADEGGLEPSAEEEEGPEPVADAEGGEPVPEGGDPVVPDGTTDAPHDVTTDPGSDGTGDGDDGGDCGCFLAGGNRTQNGPAALFLLAVALMLLPRRRRM